MTNGGSVTDTEICDGTESRNNYADEVSSFRYPQWIHVLKAIWRALPNDSEIGFTFRNVEARGNGSCMRKEHAA